MEKRSNSHCAWTYYNRASLSLGGSIKNITPWFSWTHQTLKQHVLLSRDPLFELLSSLVDVSKDQFYQRWKMLTKVKTSLGGTTRNITPWFSWTHQTLKKHRKHLNEHFHKTNFMNTFIRFHRFWKPNNINNIVYFDVPSRYI